MILQRVHGFHPNFSLKKQFMKVNTSFVDIKLHFSVFLPLDTEPSQSNNPAIKYGYKVSSMHLGNDNMSDFS